MQKIIKSEFFCDFCGKHQDDVFTMVAGPNGHAICDECTEIAMEIIIENRKKKDGEK